ncbi:nucleolar protein dao-5 [Drosophila innubila]|uniref:nucleolar protein dao-5 n=1 Tax=Drosophila innubila TaxID=198719 RepID=UPI00148D6318|nr:nucleolar protein dao-5 [Drosophila innubila]
MKRAKRWLFTTTATVLLLGLLASTDAALPFKKVSIAKTPASTAATSTTSTTTSIPDDDPENEELPQVSTSEGEENKSDNATLTKNSKLTGIPQIDYVWDPNLPRELHGYNLSSYPFLSTVPPMDEIHFKCEGLHDGFYASIEYKCQIYHHCVYGIRHDFLCANFTAFDQRTFICHFASDVDCEGSQKYWNRNDELYMATTTSSTSTTTTTTEAPPLQPRRRPQRPYHRPYSRRPVDDYYDDDDYEDDFYENRGYRHKPKARPRPRKPQPPLEYDDEYEDKDPRVEVKPTGRNRNQYRDEDDLSEDYYEEPNRPNRPGGRRGKPTSSGGGGRGKASVRKPGRGVDERRSFNEDRERDRDIDREEPRRSNGNGRRRNNEKRTTPSTEDVLDELDEYEKPYGLHQVEEAEEQTPLKVKTTPKPLTEFITPKAAPASVYSRPRAPPRIARPVPINEKKKYSYPVQKNTATKLVDEDYYQEAVEEQEQEDDYEQPVRSTSRRRTASPREQKPTRSSLRKPVTDKKPLLEDQDYYAPDTRRKRPGGAGSRTRAPPVAEPDIVDDVDYEEKTTPARTQRVRPAPRKPVQRPRQPIERVPSVEQEDEPVEELVEEQPVVPASRARVNALRRNPKLPKSSRQRALPTSRTTAALALQKEQETERESTETESETDDEPAIGDEVTPAKPQRTASVRVVKRPFLPSRGGSPYLPRGLQPVGVAGRQQQQQQLITESTPIDMGSTISGVRLLEHGAPLLRGNDMKRERDRELSSPSTLPPRSALPTSVPTETTPESQPAKLNLDELYENDYDVTLNDALDPTLKPLTSQQHPHSHPHPHQLPPQLQSRPYASAYAAPTSASAPDPAESVAYNPFAAHNQNYQQASINQNQNQNHQSSIASALHPSQSLSQSLSQSQSPSHHSSDSYFSSTDIRRRAIVPSQVTRSHRHEYAAGSGTGGGGAVRSSIQMGSRPSQQFYEDYSY